MICPAARRATGAHVVVPADQRHLRHDAPHPPVDRADHENMSAGVARPPDADTVGVDLVTRLGPRDRMAVVADLRPRVDLLAGFAIAGTEVAVVEHDRSQAVRREVLAEAVQVHLLDRRVAVGHHHGRRCPLASSGTYSQPRSVTPSASNSMSCRMPAPWLVG